MKESEILNDVLWLAIEDVSGLWEVLWDLKSHYPTMPDKERQDIALRTVRELIDRDWIELYSCKEPGGEPLKLAESDFDTILLDAKNWSEPVPGSISFRIGATDTGHSALTGNNRST